VRHAGPRERKDSYEVRNPKSEGCQNAEQPCDSLGVRLLDSFKAMSVIVILIVASLLLALAFLAGFIWAVRSGQFEDTYTPSLRILAEEESTRKKRSEITAELKN
jgi:cbb3-type cytochrome oxidase maturation protein